MYSCRKWKRESVKIKSERAKYALPGIKFVQDNFGEAASTRRKPALACGGCMLLNEQVMRETV